MQDTKPWHEDDSFWETWGSWLFNPQRIADAVVEVDKIIELLKITPGDRILDLACGAGRISLELASRGFKVTGVDRTRSYLDRASEQAKKESLDIEFIQEDMRTFKRKEEFNAVISMFTSFGYFEDAEEDKQVVANVCDSLKSGGSFLIETHGKETLAKIFRERDWNENEDGVIVLQERRVSQNWSWMWNRWIMLKGNERIEGEVSHRLFAATELIALLIDGGFSQADAFGGIDGSPYDHTARRLAVVGYK